MSAIKPCTEVGGDLGTMTADMLVDKGPTVNVNKLVLSIELVAKNPKLALKYVAFESASRVSRPAPLTAAVPTRWIAFVVVAVEVVVAVVVKEAVLIEAGEVVVLLGRAVLVVVFVEVEVLIIVVVLISGALVIVLVVLV